jgi:hypothetical protein
LWGNERTLRVPEVQEVYSFYSKGQDFTVLLGLSRDVYRDEEDNEEREFKDDIL